jgi:flagellar biosynthesis chaperone FliJ
MAPPKYPLEQLLTIKINRYDQAVKTLEEKKSLLLKEEEKLKKVEEERDKVLKHKNDKLLQLRQELDQGTTSDKIQQMKNYLKVVDENLAAKQKKVDEQIKNVRFAEQQVEIAKDDLFQKKKDVEKIEMHKKEWEKEVGYQILRKEGVEQDELGSSTDTLRKREKQRKKKSQ